MPTLEPSSAQQTLVVGIPTAISLTARSQMRAGESETVSGQLTRTDTGEGVGGKPIQCVVTARIDTMTSTLLNTTVTTDFFGRFSFTFTAPNVDSVVTVTCSFAGDDTFSPSQQSITIQVVVSVFTTLTLTLRPSTAKPGDPIIASGRLTRNDTGAGVNGMSITVFRSDTGAILGTATTTNDSSGQPGFYQVTFTAPTVPGRYIIVARFPGATVATGFLIVAQQLATIEPVFNLILLLIVIDVVVRLTERLLVKRA
jgi:hypothetical protein